MREDNRVNVCRVAVTALMLTAGATLAPAREPVDFQRQIRPILAEHCFKCHGPDEQARAAELRLDVREGAVSQSGPIVPGDAGKSELVRRVSSTDPDVIMPPPEENNPLGSAQVALLNRWIAGGAPYETHWAFTAPQRPALPEVAGPVTRADTADSGRLGPLDAFVVERLAREGLHLSPRATHEALCRRIHLDLIGLPPTPGETRAFVTAAGDDVQEAVSRLVDALLASEHFGEKWARHWLDVARYADSHGYEVDRPRQQWAWRDWVVRAINADMPYDQFLIEQIAGDLLPERTKDQLVATGFLRNSMINQEAAIIAEEFRMEAMFDRMDSIGKAVLGLSIQCAQCHTHKYDPISQEEYYGMFAFLNDTHDAQEWLYSPQQESDIAGIKSRIFELEERLKAQRPHWQAELAGWEEQERAAAPRWEVLDTTEQEWGSGANHAEELRDHSVLTLGHPADGGEQHLIAEPVLDGVTGLRLEALTFGDLPGGGPGRSHQGVFSVTELRVAVGEGGNWTEVALRDATTDFAESERIPGEEEEDAEEEEEERERERIREEEAGKEDAGEEREEDEDEEKDEPPPRVGPVEFLIDDDPLTGWRADRGPGLRNTDSVAVVGFAEPLRRPPGTQLKVTLVFADMVPGPGSQCPHIGRVRLSLTRSPEPRTAEYDHAATLAMARSRLTRSSSEEAEVFRAWRQSLPELRVFNDGIRDLESQYPEAWTSVLCLSPRSPEHRRETFLLDRGAWDQPKHPVTPHVPAVLHALPASAHEGSGGDRLTFARWLGDRNSPLTARVQVNRVWQAIFGRGLVETPEDFGTRTSQPEYRALLDWLAVEFMDGGWSLKHLIRTIVTSATYQQTSRISPELLELDPDNRLLARGPRFRAEAEVVRDIALSVSGLLSPKVGGESVFPPVPGNVLSAAGGPNYWREADGPERYRRSIYVYRRRSMPDPVLANFDAPNGEVACARRVRSNTPLAALVALNEPVFTEAGRAMALRILREGGATDLERADYAVRLSTGRGSRVAERREILALLESRRERLRSGSLSINEVATGDPEEVPATPPGTTPEDAAAWTIAARVLLNLDETLSKN